MTKTCTKPRKPRACRTCRLGAGITSAIDAARQLHSWGCCPLLVTTTQGGRAEETYYTLSRDTDAAGNVTGWRFTKDLPDGQFQSHYLSADLWSCSCPACEYRGIDYPCRHKECLAALIGRGLVRS